MHLEAIREERLIPMCSKMILLSSEWRTDYVPGANKEAET